VALALLAAEPELAYRLTVEPYLGKEDAALATHRDWVERFAGLMDAAAADDPRASRESPFLAPFLIGGVRFLMPASCWMAKPPTCCGSCPGLSRLFSPTTSSPASRCPWPGRRWPVVAERVDAGSP
jgi:hypothetical protein